VEFETDFARAGCFQKARRPVAGERDLGVRRVVAEDDVVLAAERHHALEEFEVGDRRRRIVRIVEPHQPGPLEHVSRDRREVGQPGVFGTQRHQVRLAVGHQGAGLVDRIPR
jgi:hypothetical protein